MTASVSSVGDEGLVAKVKEFYALLADGQADELADLVLATFAHDATLARPQSLPGGGRLVGSDRIAKFVRIAASGAPGLRLASVHHSPSAEGGNVFAEVAINLSGVETTALEWWTFTAAGVVSVQAYYWDTAALLAAAKS